MQARRPLQNVHRVEDRCSLKEVCLDELLAEIRDNECTSPAGMLLSSLCLLTDWLSLLILFLRRLWQCSRHCTERD